MRLFYFFALFVSLLSINFSIVNKGYSKPLIVIGNKYDAQWFTNLFNVWDAKSFAEDNDLKTIDVLLIKLALNDVELYLTELSNLLTHINDVFNNSEAFKKFKSTDSFSYNFFKFISYVNTLQGNSDEALNELLSQEFNVYEIVSIKRLTEVDLAKKIEAAKKIIVRDKLNDKNNINNICNEYDILYIQEILYTKKQQDKTPYLVCLRKINSEIGLQEKISDCNKLYAADNKENYILGLRACYLTKLNNLRNMDDISIKNLGIDQISNKLHVDCSYLVNNFLETFPDSKTFIQKHISFLINFFISYKRFNA